MTRLVVASVGLLVLACNDVTLPPRTPPGLVSLRLSSDTAPADGRTQIVVSAVLDTSLTADKLSVKFHTTAGSFGGQQDAAVGADSARTAIALLTAATDSMSAVVSATAGTSTIEKMVRFTPALPDRITMVPAQLSVKAGADRELGVTATVRRTVGTPSAGSIIAFSAIDTLGRPRGWFANAGPATGSGVVTTSYTTGDASYQGLLRLIATTTGVHGPLADTAVVRALP